MELEFRSHLFVGALVLSSVESCTDLVEENGYLFEILRAQDCFFVDTNRLAKRRLERLSLIRFFPLRFMCNPRLLCRPLQYLLSLNLIFVKYFKRHQVSNHKFYFFLCVQINSKISQIFESLEMND